MENLRGIKGRVILAANHASEWDPILIRAAFPFFTRFAPFYFVSGPKENFKSFGWKYSIYGGLLFEMLGAYAIQPGKNDYAHSLSNHIVILNHGRTLVIFPQGKRVAPDEVYKVRGGVAYLAHTTKSPVIPFAIRDTWKITLKDFLFFRRHVSVIIGKPIPHDVVVPQSTPSVDDYKEGGERVMREIERVL